MMQQISKLSLSASLALTLATAFSAIGCHRQYYRKQADIEAHCLIDEKASHVARPPVAPIRVEVDPRSRMFNPFDLDFQPMPLDDPAAYRYMQCVDGRRGYPMWEAAGFTNTAENPDWWQFLPLDEDGVLVLNADNAVSIALLHSRDYQQQVENLYFAALNVSAERFFFDTQFFGGADTSLTASKSSTLAAVGLDSVGPRDLALRRRFAAGGELIAGIANNIVWELNGANTQTASTLLDFSLIQPLLRNAGRDKVLENLTASERQLLYAVRQFERYRRNFYLNVTIGRGIEGPVQIASRNINSSVNAFGAGGGGAGGFLGLLQNELQIRNSEENIARQSENLLILEDSLIELLTTIPDNSSRILSDRLQVAQTRQSLLRSQSQLVQQQANFKRSLDQFLGTLGLPPYICVRLDDPILDRFELIDRDLVSRREELSVLRGNAGSLNVEILEQGEFRADPDTGLPVSHIPWTPILKEKLARLRAELEPVESFIDQLLEQDLPVIQQDIDKLSTALPQRRQQNASLVKLYEREKESICGLLEVPLIDDAIFDMNALTELDAELISSVEQLAARLRKYKERLEKLQSAFDTLGNAEAGTIDPRDLAIQLRDEIILASQNLLAELGDDVLALQLIQARARTESVLLPEIDISPEIALEIARNNRRDWANARGILVDQWRNIEVVADDLESTLDLTFSGGVGNASNKPFKLSSASPNTRLRVGLQWDAPITRLLERNDYRRALIQYEQARRSFYNFEDSIWQVLRAEVRQLQANRFTFELGRQSVGIAAEQIELNTDIRVTNEARQVSNGPTAARDAIGALSDLLNAQNGLLNIFVNYEILRRSLDFDLGTMELTPNGLWIDPGKLSPAALMRLPGTNAEGLIECGRCNECGIPYHSLPVEPKYGTEKLQSGHGFTDPELPKGLMGPPGAYGEMDKSTPAGVPVPKPLLEERPMPAEAPVPADTPAPADMSVPSDQASAASLKIQDELPPLPKPEI